MLQLDLGRTPRYCDGVSRRSFLRLGVAGMGSASLAGVLQAQELSQKAGRSKKDTAVILIWLDGGPGHMDLYDMKPEAPVEYRGIWNPIKTNVAGIEISELFPLQAKVADKFSIVRSLSHGTGDHFTAADFMLTGRGIASGGNTATKYPCMASVATAITGARREGIPPYVAIPYAMSVGIRPGYFGANYVGVEHNPFETEGDPNSDNFQVQNLSMNGSLTVDRLEDRRSLLAGIDQYRSQIERTQRWEAMDRFQQQAHTLVTSPAAREAFDLSREKPETRDRYGRHSLGQSALLARRLIEAGVTFVTIHSGGWDHHWDLAAGMKNLLPTVDSAMAGLLSDLAERGLHDRVLVMLCGEFSRTPRMNDGSGNGTPGRDHWGNSMFCLMGGGGVKGGRIIGSTDAKGETPKDHPLKPGDIHATMFEVLGVDPQVSFLNHAGRPVTAIEEGKVIQELL
jgi:Protein of unknown function (DUF1501)